MAIFGLCEEKIPIIKRNINASLLTYYITKLKMEAVHKDKNRLRLSVDKFMPYDIFTKVCFPFYPAEYSLWKIQ
ncbi:hypothetical protein D4R99_01055 [bacterium]|nr:MAG: hypothetical protein D4R99_01055 [bacterium]